jgi:hypothetical protein
VPVPDVTKLVAVHVPAAPTPEVVKLVAVTMPAMLVELPEIAVIFARSCVKLAVVACLAASWVSRVETIPVVNEATGSVTVPMTVSPLAQVTNPVARVTSSVLYHVAASSLRYRTQL